MKNDSDLFFTCSLIEFIGRQCKLKRKQVIEYLGKDVVKRIYKYASLHSELVEDEHEWKVCDNYTVDTVVRHYLKHAKVAGAELPAKLGILDTDLTIVLGNLFENVAQAVMKKYQGAVRFT